MTKIDEKFEKSIIIGLAGRIGTDFDKVMNLLNLHAPPNYETKLIHISELVTGKKEKNLLEKIKKCNEYTKKHGSEGIINLINQEIKKIIDDEEDKNKNYIFIIRSLKRLNEWKLLKWTYGRSFYCLSIHISKCKARENLYQIIERDRIKGDDYKELVEIFESDEDEKHNNHGQELPKIMPYCDYFIDIESQATPKMIKRFIDIVFGECFIAPTAEELGMHYAYTASMRSLDQSRQVGVAVLDKEGHLLVTGTNGVPKFGGDIYYDPSRPEDPNYKHKTELMSDIIKKLDLKVWKSKEKELEEKLKETRLNDLLEFSNVLHAEQHALANAARLGVPVKDATMYVTTFPCHLCAKVIIGSGIKRVVYIHPYHKSLATELNDDSCCIDHEVKDKLVFKHFEGLSPYRFLELFTWGKREDKESKTIPKVNTLKAGHVKRRGLIARMKPIEEGKAGKIHEPDYNALEIKKEDSGKTMWGQVKTWFNKLMFKVRLWFS